MGGGDGIASKTGPLPMNLLLLLLLVVVVVPASAAPCCCCGCSWM